MSATRIVSLVVAVGLLAACGGGAAEQKAVANTPAAKEPEPLVAKPQPAAPAEATDPGDRILATMRGFQDDVCACASAACIEGVEQRIMDWAMANMEELKDIKPTPAQDAEADRIDDEMDACKARHASTPPAPSTPPPASKMVLTPLPPGGTGVPSCDAYVRTIDTMLATCQEKLGPALDAMVQGRNAAVEAFAQWGTLDAKSRKAAREAAETGCTAATDAIRQTATALGCPG